MLDIFSITSFGAQIELIIARMEANERPAVVESAETSHRF